MHAWADKYSVALAAAILKNRKWFRYSLNSPTFKEHLNSIELSLPEIIGEGVYEASGTYTGGTIDPAFHVVRWVGHGSPTILYHHGNNEQPFNYHLGSKNTFKSVIMAKKELFGANIINLRAPFHNDGMKFYLEKIGNLADFTAMLAGSVKLVELLVQHAKAAGSPRVMVTGVSLGGWVTNMHRSYCNTADVYVPMLAGAALDALFTTSYYHKLTSHLAKENPTTLREILNFEREFISRQSDNVFPLLARYDQIIEYERQKQCYGQTPIKVLDKGHITAAMAAGELRNHLLTHLSG